MKLIPFALAALLALASALADDEPTSKKGICLSKKTGDVGEIKKRITALNAGWHYNWIGDWDGSKVKDAPFVPMVWGKTRRALDPMKDHRVSKSKMETSPLLGFNEPDGKKQANMSVKEALDLWPTLQKTNRRLGSPSTVHAHNEWMQAFMKQAGELDYRVDFICVHWYGANSPDKFIEHLHRIHEMYGKRPLWITEFAIADWSATSRKSNKHSPESVLKFMKAVLPQLEELDFVERYAWFTSPPDHPKLGPSALFDDSGRLTPLGEFYASQ